MGEQEDLEREIAELRTRLDHIGSGDVAAYIRVRDVLFRSPPGVGETTQLCHRCIILLCYRDPEVRFNSDQFDRFLSALSGLGGH